MASGWRGGDKEDTLAGLGGGNEVLEEELNFIAFFLALTIFLAEREIFFAKIIVLPITLCFAKRLRTRRQSTKSMIHAFKLILRCPLKI